MNGKFLRLTWAVLAIANTATGCTLMANLEQPAIAPKPQPTAPQAMPANPSEFSNMEKKVHQMVNQYRQGQNLPPLTLDERISAQARKHSSAMASGEVPFSHDRFDGRIKAIAQTLSYNAAAENVAYNVGYSEPVKQAVTGWIDSPGHQKNMVGNYDLTGIGIAQNAKGEYYYTQIFIKRR